MILRIYGRGVPVLPRDAGWETLAKHFALLPGTRQIFAIDVEIVQISCGYGVPFTAFDHERETLKKLHKRSDPQEWEAKMAMQTASIDGLPTRPTDRYIAGK